MQRRTGSSGGASWVGASPVIEKHIKGFVFYIAFVNSNFSDKILEVGKRMKSKNEKISVKVKNIYKKCREIFYNNNKILSFGLPNVMLSNLLLLKKISLKPVQEIFFFFYI